MERFKELYAQLNAKQKEAVDTIEGPLLVIAGPGTGKTQLLSLRVANILRKSQVESFNVLCLTFTESAAHEMRQRLVSIIGQSAYNVSISTYHAFGSEIISRFSDYTSTKNETEAVDELGIYSIVSGIVDELDHDNPLSKSSFYIKDIISTISDLKRATLSPNDLSNIADQNLKAINSCSDYVKKAFNGHHRISKKVLPDLEKLLEKLKRERTIKSVRGVRPLTKLFAESLGQALAESYEQDSTKPVTAWKNSWLEKDADDNFVLGGKKQNEKLAALADVYQRYLLELHTRGLHDYDDMIIKAIELVRTNDEVRYTLQEQYQYILLDEFQDTNAAQFDLVQLIANSEASNKHPNIMAVGDDDQAIYAFQGADYSHMFAFSEIFKDVKTVTLTDNYRSQQQILDTSEKVSQQIETRLTTSQITVQKRLTAKNSSRKKAIIERRDFRSDVAQYAWVASKIEKLISKGVEPSDIAILAPKHKYIEPIVPYLQSASISVQYEKRENVLLDPQIIELVQMSRLVIALHNQDIQTANNLWPEVLSYDCFDIPIEEIWETSWNIKQGSPWTNNLLKNKQTSQVTSFFLKLSSLVEQSSFETMLDYLIGNKPVKLSKSTLGSPFYDYYFGKQARDQNTNEYWSLLTNLTVLRQKIREQHTSDFVSIVDFVTFIEAHQQADIKILNTSPYHQSSDAVQVMTAYRSKGQEFEHVFLLATIDEVWGSKTINKRPNVPLPPNLNFVRYSSSSDDERLRLLFVALTRARTGLYLTSYQANYNGKQTTDLKYLSESTSNGARVSPFLPEEHQEIIQSDKNPPRTEELTSYWQDKHLESTTTLRSLLKPRLDRYQLAPTHLNNFVDVMYGGPEQMFLTTILRFPQAPSVDGVFGNLMHECIEWIHKVQVESDKLPTVSALKSHYRKQLMNTQLAPKEKAKLDKRGAKALESFYKQRQHTFNASDIHEMNFKNQGVLVGNAHLSGKIDKLIINPKTKEIVVVDYKTGESANKWSSTVKLRKYKQQLYIYKLLVEGSHQFMDYTVTDAYLEFIESDDNGKIQELHLGLNQKEQQDIKELVQAVWKHVQELNFPDISDYPQSYKGMLLFEQDLTEGNI